MPRFIGAFLFYVQDVLAENCSCIFCTSAIHGGRMSRDAYREVGGRECLEHILEDTGVRSDDLFIKKMIPNLPL